MIQKKQCCTRGFTPGFTLVELLVVMLIIGMAWFAILPRLDITRRNAESDAEKLNEFILQVRETAMNKQTIQKVVVTPGKEELFWGKEKLKLSASVSTCRVNGDEPILKEFAFFVYPEGMMDKVRMELLSGEVLVSDALNAAFARDTSSL